MKKKRKEKGTLLIHDTSPSRRNLSYFRPLQKNSSCGRRKKSPKHVTIEMARGLSNPDPCPTNTFLGLLVVSPRTQDSQQSNPPLVLVVVVRFPYGLSTPHSVPLRAHPPPPTPPPQVLTPKRTR